MSNAISIPCCSAASTKPCEIVKRAQLRVNRLVAAFLRTDSPRAAHVVRLGLGGVVLSFAKRLADRMNGRQIQHVESHFGDVGQASLDIFQRAMLTPGSGAQDRGNISYQALNRAR